MQRPIEVPQDPRTPQQQIIADLLWSDPSQNENDNELVDNKNYGIKNVVKYSNQRLRSFLTGNGYSLIIRSHECVNEGFEQSAAGQLMTIFSCTDYCGKFTNSAAIAVIRKNFELVPKVISSKGSNQYTHKEEEKENVEPKMSGHGGGISSTGTGLQHKMSF
mmetsp:Transcript_35214/g.31676  ORF Transcript_35214/g.31676 Transcript_35214/m.31676 type:complete len:162 (+) Transcript_35214:1303-1788(+)